MDLSDSLTPSGPTLESRALTPAPPALSADQQVDEQVSGLISNGLQRVYGRASEEARTSIVEARAAEGARVFDRIVDNPTAFAPVENAAYAPHLREAYTYQEWLAADRSVSLPDTHLLDRSDMSEGSDARHERETEGTEQAAGEQSADDPYISLGPTRDVLEIQRLLDPEAHLPLDYGVTREDMDAIGEIVRAFPSVEHGSHVLLGLDEATLQRWADNLDDPAIQGGLDAAERRVHYSALAKNLDATQFGRFAEAVVRAGNSTIGGRGVDEARWFSHAAIETAPTETLGSFVEQATARGRSSSDESLAPAVAEAVRGLSERDPERLARVLAPYTKDDTQWLVSGAVFQEIVTTPAMQDGNSVTMINHDAVSLSRALYAVAAVGNVETKGLFFAAAAEQMATLRALPATPSHGVMHAGVEEAAGNIRIGLSHVVHSNTSSVMASLALSADPDGVATVAYAEAQLAAGQTDRVRTTLEMLLQGNGRRESATDRFGPEHNVAPSKIERDNAAALGHYTGAIAAAIENRSSDRAEQAEALTSVFAGVLAVGISSAGPTAAGGRIVRGAASALAEPLIESIAASISRFSAGGDLDLGGTLLEIARPQVPNVGSSKGGLRPHEGLAVTNDFTDHFDHVVVTNHNSQHR